LECVAGISGRNYLTRAEWKKYAVSNELSE